MDSRSSEFWRQFRSLNPAAPNTPAAAYHFCDNETDAETCLQLVLAGKKRATAASLKEYELAGDTLPVVGEFSVVTDFSGTPRAVIETTRMEIVRFGDVNEQFARDEGEGDLSLDWWRNAHRAYFTRVLSGTSTIVDDDLMIACEHFRLVHPM